MRTSILFAGLICTFVASAQNSLLVHQSGGAGTLPVPLYSIDSISFSTSGPQEFMNIHLATAPDLIFELSEIDSLTYDLSGDTLCDPPDVFNPALTYGSVTDIDGNVYRTIVVGTQEWMAENLRTGHYRNGDPVPVVTDPLDWIALNSGASAWFNNDSAAIACPYGRMYNWYAMVDPRHVCPTGWHEPDNAEWDVIINLFGGITVAGGPLKSAGTTYWNSPNGGATNSSGLSLLPGGQRSGSSGTYSGTGNGCSWWTTTDPGGNNGWYRAVNYANPAMVSNTFSKRSGFYIRCIKD